MLLKKGATGHPSEVLMKQYELHNSHSNNFKTVIFIGNRIVKSALLVDLDYECSNNFSLFLQKKNAQRLTKIHYG